MSCYIKQLEPFSNFLYGSSMHITAIQISTVGANYFIKHNIVKDTVSASPHLLRHPQVLSHSYD